MLDSMQTFQLRRGAAIATFLSLALTGCTRPDGFDTRQGATTSRLDVAPLYSEAYQGRLECLDCDHGRVDTELVLYRERRTGAPAGFQINQRYLDQETMAETSHHGSWLVMQNGASPRDRPVYRLEPDGSTLPALLLEQVNGDRLVTRDMADQADASGLERSAFPANGDLSVTEADSGLPITIQVGQTLTVSLAAEAGNRFAWRLVTPPDGALEPLGSPMRVAAGQLRQQVETDSTAVWQFLGRYPGEMALRFELESVANAEATPARIVRYRVRVQ